MNFDITQVPFSCRGSYLALSQNEGEFGGRTAEPGLYLRTVRGAAKDPFLARLTPLCGGRPAAFAPQADPACLHLAADGADIDIAFADAATLLLRGRGAAAGLCLDFLSAGRPYTMLEPLPAAEGVYYASCYVSRTRLVLRAQRGRVCIDQAWNVSSADHARLTAYVNWSSLVDASGFLKRETMYMSKNWMCSVYSWDHCFNAIALAQRDPALAWDQFMVLFDHQSAAGRLPDSVNDSEVVDNFCKPPIHGWALHKMRERMTLTRPMQAEAYDKLARWTLWWLNCRDRDGDGLCEYTHGNDSAGTMRPPSRVRRRSRCPTWPPSWWCRWTSWPTLPAASAAAPPRTSGGSARSRCWRRCWPSCSMPAGGPSACRQPPARASTARA